jgi:hypothetical protein
MVLQAIVYRLFAEAPNVHVLIDAICAQRAGRNSDRRVRRAGLHAGGKGNIQDRSGRAGRRHGSADVPGVVGGKPGRRHSDRDRGRGAARRYAQAAKPVGLPWYSREGRGRAGSRTLGGRH